jgi:hypothetical protein
MLANLLPEYFSLIPIGLLLGILLAFRKLALSSNSMRCAASSAMAGCCGCPTCSPSVYCW